MTNGHRYIQYQANLSGDTTATPSLDSVTLGYSYYPTTPQTLTSPKYNSGDPATRLGGLKWNETLLSGTGVNFKIKTASTTDGLDSATYYTFTNADCTKNGTEVTCSEAQLQAKSATLTDGENDQYFQYQIELTSDDIYTPTFSDSTITYVVNAAPEIQNVSAIQNSDGTVTVNYQVRDQDTATGATPYEVAIDLQYCTANCSTPGSETWATASTLSGDYGAGIEVEESDYNSYSLTWTAKTDYPDQYNGTNFKIRIRANDGEAANNYGYGESNTFELDTKDPQADSNPATYTAIKIDGRESNTMEDNEAILTLQAQDDTDRIAFKYSLNSDLTSDGINSDSGEWILLSAEDTVSLKAGTYTKNIFLDPADKLKQDTVYIQYRDKYQNTNSTIYSVSTPERPTAMMIQDITNTRTDPDETGLIILWKTTSMTPGSNQGQFVSYTVERAQDPSSPWTPVKVITDYTENYYRDNDVDFDEDYYYRVYTTDGVGNISYYSATEDSDDAVLHGIPNGTQDAGEGGGGTSGEPPTISDVSYTNLQTSQVTITWTTDEPATSAVGYSTTPGNFSQEIGLSSFNTEHSVTLTGLDPDTTYYYRVKSTNARSATAYDPESGNGYTFTTNPGPKIYANPPVIVEDIKNNQATISWYTDVSSDTYVVYQEDTDGVCPTTLDNPTETGNPNLVTGADPIKHTYTLNNLTANTYYCFYVKSSREGLTAIANNAGANYLFKTTQDEIAPQITSGPAALLITYNQAVIKWTTDEPATAQIRYKKSSASYSDWYPTDSLTYDYAHYIILPDTLSSDTTYTYQIRSSDINGNQTNITTEYTFKTLKDPAFQHKPLTQITTPQTSTTAGSAVIKFTTQDEDSNNLPAQCVLEYKVQGQNYNLNDPVTEDGYNETHTLHLTGLNPGTLHYYKLTCQDNLENTVQSDEYSFTTSSQVEGDIEAPTISNIKVSAITGESVTVSWETNEKSDSLVQYGITKGTYENAGADYLVNSDVYNYVTNHEVIINNLTPGTRYYFVIISTDSSGNKSKSSEQTFTTSSVSSLRSIKVSSTKLGEAIVTWETQAKTTSRVEYGTTTAYGETKESSTYTQNHEITLSGLKQNTEYHLRVSGKDDQNNLYSSGDYTFTPKSPPQIQNIQTKNATEHEITIAFTTNVPTDSLVTFNPTSSEAKLSEEGANSASSGSQGTPDLKTNHEITLKNLAPGTTYTYTITVKDIDGNSTTEPNPESNKTLSFTTGLDTNPPQIDQLRSDNALAQGDKVQTIISWFTDEPATTEVIYREGLNAEKKEIIVSRQYSTTHIAVITSFKTGTVYYFNARSSDQAGNTSVSGDFAMLTPKRKENIVQIIISNFQEIFSWAKF